MKAVGLSILALGAALVEAAPLRVVVVTSTQLSQNLRFGHAVSNTNMDIAHIVNSPGSPFMAGPEGHTPNQFVKKPCFMRNMHEKAVEISNVFRQALGLPLIEAPRQHGHHGTFKILPFVGTEPTFIEVNGSNGVNGLDGTTRGGDRIKILPIQGSLAPDNVPAQRFHRNCWKRIRDTPFLKRLSVALMSLGPWEGRAVAFVLGCGIGVLLRMIFVLCYVTFRAVKGQKKQQVEYTIIEEYIDDDAENISVPPPTYTYIIDEKPDMKKSDEVA